MKKGKRYLEVSALVDKTNTYDPKEAMELVLKTAKAKFDESVELHVKLGVDGRSADQQVRGTVVLPNGTGKTKKVLVLTNTKLEDAKNSGADYFGGKELLEKIINDKWFDFDVICATPDMMGEIGKAGRILGPKGLMPNPKTGTVTMDVAKAVNEVKAGKVTYRVDKAGNIHVPIGKVSFDNEKLVENFATIHDVLVKAKPSAAKGQYMKNITVTTTFGPGIHVDQASF